MIHSSRSLNGQWDDAEGGEELSLKGQCREIFDHFFP